MPAALGEVHHDKFVHCAVRRPASARKSRRHVPRARRTQDLCVHCSWCRWVFRIPRITSDCGLRHYRTRAARRNRTHSRDLCLVGSAAVGDRNAWHNRSCAWRQRLAVHEQRRRLGISRVLDCGSHRLVFAWWGRAGAQTWTTRWTMRYVDQPQYGRVTWQQIRDSARQAAERAVALDPTLADSQIAMGKYYVAAARDWDAAAPYLERARRLDPADP